jgi:hypothetical protein
MAKVKSTKNEPYPARSVRYEGFQNTRRAGSKQGAARGA